MLRSAEELFLLLFDQDAGGPILYPSRTVRYALAGAVLMDLQLECRIDSDLSEVVVVDPTPLDDDLLDPTLAAIASSEQRRDANYWVQAVASTGDEIQENVISRLVGQGILTNPDDGVVALRSRVRRSGCYSLSDGSIREIVHHRILRALLTDEIPDPADVVLVSLADACGAFQQLLSRAELRAARKRIELLRVMDLIGQAVHRLVHEVRPTQPARRALHEELPKAKGLPIVGDTVAMGRGIRKYLTDRYLEFGPIFTVNLLSKNYIVLAGPEANLFMQNREQFHLQTTDMWDTMTKELGATRLLLGMDGADHFRMRRELRDGFSSKRLTSSIPEAVRVVRLHIDKWGLNTPQRSYSSFQHLVADQLGILIADASPEGYSDEIIRMVKAIVSNSLLVKSPLPWRTRQYRRDRAKVMEFLGKVLRKHQLGRCPTFDYIDAGLDLHKNSPSFLPELDLPLWTFMPYALGIDTAASTLAFMLYAVLKRPALMDRIRSEADECFGEPDDGLNTKALQKLDVTKRTFMETLRMYPVFPVVIRRAVSSFDFQGYRIPAGEDLIIAIGVSNYLPRLFPRPDDFDIDRYLPSRAEHRQPGAFAPFGLGAHRCLGANLSSVQVPLTIATVLHEVELELDPSHYELKITQNPFQAPSNRFQFRIVKRRQLR